MYQVQQHEKGKAIIYIVKGKDFDERQKNKINADFKATFKNDLVVTFQYVDHIEASPSGKRRAIISHIATKSLPLFYSEQ